MNSGQRARPGFTSKSSYACDRQPCALTKVCNGNIPLAFGRPRLRNLFRIAATIHDACLESKSSCDSIPGNVDLAHGSLRKLSQLTSSAGNSVDEKTQLRWRLQQIWQTLCGCLAIAARLLAIALVFSLGSLLCKPAPAHAAAATDGSPIVLSPATTSVKPTRISSHKRTPDDLLCPMAPASSQSTHWTAAFPPKPAGAFHPHYLADQAIVVPIVEIAAAPAPTFAFASLASSAGRGPGTSLASASSSRSDLASSSQDASLRVGASASNIVAPSITFTTNSGNATAGSTHAHAPAASTSEGVPGVDMEAVALAQQLGVGLSEARAIRLFERQRASVVNISGMRAMQTFTTLDLGKLPFGQGSGFLWGDKGHVVTCYHLVKGTAEVKVTLYDNSSYTAKVIGYDAAKNVAVLKLSVPKSKLRELQPVTLGSAARLRVGQTVYGISNPWGLGHTLSQGPICGQGQELSYGLLSLKGVLRVGCAADPGSSGGPLMDGEGRVVGMMVALQSAASGGAGGGTEGKSFAVPMDAIRGLVNQILLYGRTVRPALGITMAPAQVVESVGLEGVLVLEVPPGTPAHAAGLRPTHRDIFGDLVLGDIIVGLDSKVIRSSLDLYDVLDDRRVGDRVKLDVVRDGKQMSLSVTLGERLLGAIEE